MQALFTLLQTLLHLLAFVVIRHIYFSGKEKRDSGTDEKCAGYRILAKWGGNVGSGHPPPPPLPDPGNTIQALAGNNLSTQNKGVNTATRASLGEAHGVCDDFQETCQIL